MCFHSSSTNTAGAAAGITHWVGLCVQAECEFVAEGISKVHVQKADKEEDCWRYMLRWRRLPHVNTQVTAVPSALSCLAKMPFRGKVATPVLMTSCASASLQCPC